MAATSANTKFRVEGLAFGYDGIVVQHDISFEVGDKSIFAIMGGSGSGKSTLMKTMIGLLRRVAGSIHVRDEDYSGPDEERRFGVVFQPGALWSSMTAEDNVAVPLRMFPRLNDSSIRELARLKLSLVRL